MNEAMMAKAKEAKSVAELMELAKAENMQMTEEKANEIFAHLHAEGELSDNDLDDVAGGGCNDTGISNYRCGDIVALKGNKRCQTIYDDCQGSLFKITREMGSEYEVECTTCYTLQIVAESDIAGRIS